MLIAIPICQGRVSPVFDTAARLLVVRRRKGRAGPRDEIQLGFLPADALARSLRELHIDVLLCAAISEPLLRSLESLGIQVVPHLCGEVEAIVEAFCSGHLRRADFRMPGCWGRHLDEPCCRFRRRRPTAAGRSTSRGRAARPSETVDSIPTPSSG